MKKLEKMQELAAQANKNMGSKPYGFAHGAIGGVDVTANAYVVNTNSKKNQFGMRWFISGKRASAKKVEAL